MLKNKNLKAQAKEVSFEWSHHRISSTDSKVRITVTGLHHSHHSFIHSSRSVNERVKVISNGDTSLA